MQWRFYIIHENCSQDNLTVSCIFVTPIFLSIFDHSIGRMADSSDAYRSIYILCSVGNAVIGKFTGFG